MPWLIEFGKYYRLGYDTGNGAQCNAYPRFVEDDADRQTVIKSITDARRDYPRYKFWLEVADDHGRNWTKLKEHNPYELFSEDIEEETPPPKPKPESPWRFINSQYHSSTDNGDIPF